MNATAPNQIPLNSKPQLPKYSLREPSAEELAAFRLDFQALVDKHSVYFEPIPMWRRVEIGRPWETQCDILINKKVEIPAETPSQPNDIASGNPSTPVAG